MPVQPAEQIKTNVIELCSEDDYGSWELWWNISAKAPPDQMPALKRNFLDVVSELVSVGRLIAKRQRMDGQITEAEYNREKLAHEIDSAGSPDRDSFFWFGTE
jgi:hypothetical protein